MLEWMPAWAYQYPPLNVALVIVGAIVVAIFLYVVYDITSQCPP